jgi:hypothetical protein
MAKTKKTVSGQTTLAAALKKRNGAAIVSPSHQRILSGLFFNTEVYTPETGALEVFFNPEGSPTKIHTTTPRQRWLRKLPLRCRLSRGEGASPVKMRLFAHNVRSYEGRVSQRSSSPLCSDRLELLDESQKGCQDVEITVERLERWANCLRRRIDQNRVMGISARNYMASYGQNVGEHTDYDWLHLFAHSLGGADGENPQIKENLVAGTHACNMLMLEFAETALKSLVKEHRLVGFKLSVFAELMPFEDRYTHIATKIRYSVEYRGRSFDISFYPLEEVGVNPWTHAAQIKQFLQNSLLPESILKQAHF